MFLRVVGCLLVEEARYITKLILTQQPTTKLQIYAKIVFCKQLFVIVKICFWFFLSLRNSRVDLLTRCHPTDSRCIQPGDNILKKNATTWKQLQNIPNTFEFCDAYMCMRKKHITRKWRGGSMVAFEYKCNCNPRYAKYGYQKTQKTSVTLKNMLVHVNVFCVCINVTLRQRRVCHGHMGSQIANGQWLHQDQDAGRASSSTHLLTYKKVLLVNSTIARKYFMLYYLCVCHQKLNVLVLDCIPIAVVRWERNVTKSQSAYQHKQY